MILTLIFIAILVIGIVVYRMVDWFSGWNTVSILVIVFGAFTVIVCLSIAICVNINAEGRYQAKLAERESIVYQLENQTYLNDNNLGTEELFDRIAGFNKEVLVSRAGHNDPFISWFYPAWYEKIELIEY